MVFSDPAFLFYFLPVTLLAYWLAGRRFRNMFLFVVSFVFYMSGGGGTIVLLSATAVGTYLFGLFLDRFRDGSQVRIIKLAGVALLLGSLIYWKYLGFLARQTSALFSHLGLSVDLRFNVVLPIAISFFTFQCISYLVDVARGEIRTERSLTTFLCYVFLFPHLLAGPVVRYRDVVEQLSSRPSNLWLSFASSCPRFLWGLAKKVLIADQAGQIADAVFSVAGYQLTTLDTVIGVVAYTVQIYFDFSGYSDMAIGLAGMFGIKFQENFRRPYSAVTVTDFWRRWHISLSTWFRDYVYIPLGGNRKGVTRTYRNLLVVFVLTGFWHGANWTFLLWGLLHGTALVLERLILKGRDVHRRFHKILLRVWTLGIVMFGWMVFRAVDVPHALDLLTALDGAAGVSMSPIVGSAVTTQRVFWMTIGLTSVFLSGRQSFGERLSSEETGAVPRLLAVGVGSVACLYALSSSFSPFLYFQF